MNGPTGTDEILLKHRDERAVVCAGLGLLYGPIVPAALAFLWFCAGVVIMGDIVLLGAVVIGQFLSILFWAIALVQLPPRFRWQFWALSAWNGTWLFVAIAGTLIGRRVS